jgi:hypothetical protein
MKTKPELKVPVHTTSLIVRQSEKHGLPVWIFLEKIFSCYFYVRFRAATVVIMDGGGIFRIWRVGEEIWMHYFWAKGLGGSWFLFFSWRGWVWGFRGLNRWNWTGVGNVKDWVGGSTGSIMHQVHTSMLYLIN